MKFIKLVEQRYSLRKFSDKPIEKEKLDLVLKAGQLAPTACNYQPQRILVIENEGLEILKRCTKFHFGARMVLLICYDNAISWKRSFDHKDSGDTDASIVSTHMMLQATEIGLGTTWVGLFDPDLIAKEFNLPNNIVPVVLMPLGYPSQDATQSPHHNKRKLIKETVFYNDFLK